MTSSNMHMVLSTRDGTLLYKPTVNEDVMHPSSLVHPKRKRRRNVRDEERKSMTCAVCGEKARGYNFDVITCDSCKVFFRRISIREDIESDIESWMSECTQGSGTCVITKTSRKRCSPCRMKRCLEVGMKREWITPLSDLVRRSNFHGHLRRKSGNTSSSDSSKLDFSTARSTNDETFFQTNHDRDTSAIEQGENQYNIKMEDCTDDQINEPSVVSDAVRLPFTNYVPSMVNFSHIPATSMDLVLLSPSAGTFDDTTTILTGNIFNSYLELLSNLHFTLMQPITEEDVEQYNFYEKRPTPECFFNSKEFAVRRLIRAFKEIPQFTLLSKDAQIGLVKNAMRGLTTLFFLMYINLETETAVFECVTSRGKFRSVEFMFDNRMRHGIYSIPAEQYPAIIDIFEPYKTEPGTEFIPLVNSDVIRDFMEYFPSTPYKTTIEDLFTDSSTTINKPETSSMDSTFINSRGSDHSSHSLLTPLENMFQTKRESIEQQVDTIHWHLRKTCHKLVELAGYDQRILAIVCLMRLYGVDEDLSHLNLAKNDEHLIRKTQNELLWFLMQYARKIWSSSVSTEEEEETVTFQSTDLFKCGSSTWCPERVKLELMNPSSYDSAASHSTLSERLVALRHILACLGKIEKFNYHFQYHIKKEQVSPLMKEFLPTESEPR